jgi:hypothetical protein
MHNAPLLNTVLEIRHEDSDWAFNVMIAYDDVAAGQRAMQIVSNLARDHEGELGLQPQPWRFDLLADPYFREFATADARKADLVIISTGSESDLPAAVRSWMTACLAQKQGSGAVVALLGTEGHMDTADSPRLQFLQNAAKEAGLEFFAPQLACPKTSGGMAKRIQNREEMHAQTLKETRYSSAPGLISFAIRRENLNPSSLRHWGINE